VRTNDPEPAILEQTADARQQMIIAAAKRADDQRHLHERSPIKAKLPDGRPHEAADKDHFAATFLTG
jgi:hypothetical protein